VKLTGKAQGTGTIRESEDLPHVECQLEEMANPQVVFTTWGFFLKNFSSTSLSCSNQEKEQTMKKKMLVTFMILLSINLFAIQTAFSFNQSPNLNLGSTNILDGVIPPPGLYSLNYMTYYSADEFMDGDGDPSPGNNEVDTLVYVPQLIYSPDISAPHNLRFGLSALLSFQKINADSSRELEENQNMLGDLIIGPFVGSAVPLGNDFMVHWFLQLDTYVPIGSYEKTKQLNPSANYFSIEPFLSLTLQMPKGFAVSTRQHFTYNFKNDDYLNEKKETTGELQAGPLYHFNFSASKNLPFIHPKLRVGAVGYYLHQLSEDEFEGQRIADSEERVFAIGPGISWIHKDIFLGLKVLFENGAQNRAEGTKSVFQVRFRF